MLHVTIMYHVIASLRHLKLRRTLYNAEANSTSDIRQHLLMPFSRTCL